ncbi:MAG: dTDP-4-dehydrorhamnose 3,5-epimerase [Saprospiraceae bacterium]|nr:dTDP-4-dehydrorhamnose 3,5-epimerase [Saprospiraceae bacterium]
MPFIKTEIEDLIIFEPQIWEDDRGYFYESFNEATFKTAGIKTHFVQDNQAKSSYGVLRGLHYQVGSHAQAKLVRVISGEVLDVVVDLRPSSKTYGKSFSILLSAINKKQLFVPRGFAHGYAVLSETAEFFYKCDNFYNKEAEGGLIYNDEHLAIDWKLDQKDISLSEKDRVQPAFGDHKPAL